jgi:predicted P-loop ATPase
MVGLIAAMHGEVVPIMLVLCGTKQNTGKTEWFRRLLPNDLKEYYAESKLDMGKDDEILMTQKLMIVDDEMGGKSKLESKRLKELTSKEIFSLREPYGRQNVDLKRLAVLGGTSNDPGILNDPTGNRRIIPINVLSIDHRKYNSIDKTDLLIECYWLYKSGFDFHLSNAEIKVLNNNTEEFEQTSREYELFNRYFRLPMEGEECDSLTNSEICMKIEQLSSQRISQHKIGMELQKMGLKRYRKWINNRVLWVYDIIQKIHQ